MTRRQVVVLAGGLGTRVRSLTGDTVPKALLDVAGKPFLARKVDELAAQGATDVLLLTGHGGDRLREFLASNPLPLPVCQRDDGDKLLGTAGALRAAFDDLAERFWVTYGDTFLTVPLPDAEMALERSGAKALMTILHNRDRVQASNTSIDGEGWVCAYGKSAEPGRHEWIDYGMLLFTREVVEALPPGCIADLSTVFEALIRQRSLVGFEVTEPFHDIGTPEALARTATLFNEPDR